MIVRLLAFGIARDILDARTAEFELNSGNSVADLKRALISKYEAFSALASLAFAVNEEYVTDDFILHENDEVVLIPPVSGG